MCVESLPPFAPSPLRDAWGSGYAGGVGTHMSSVAGNRRSPGFSPSHRGRPIPSRNEYGGGTVMRRSLLALVAVLALPPPVARAQVAVQVYALPAGGGSPHDVAVGADG